jgi:hypothetical protein
LFVVMFAAGIVLSGNSPALNASTAKITQYYQDHHAGILVSELLINLASVVLLWFLGGLHAILRQRDEHGLLAPVVLASGAATVALGMVSDLAGTVAGLLAAQHSLGDPSLTRALLDINTGLLPASDPDGDPCRGHPPERDRRPLAGLAVRAE